MCWRTCLEPDYKFELGEREKAETKKHLEAFGLDKITPPIRHKQFVRREGQIGISIYTSLKTNPLREQHPNTESYLKSQSPVAFGGSSVDSAEDGSLNNREDKILI